MKKIFVILLVCTAAVIISTQSTADDYSEVSDLELIRVLGVDRAENDIVLTACSGMGIGKEQAVIAGTNEKSLTSAIKFLGRSATEHEPFFSHVEHFLISESAAGSDKGIGEFLDYICRSTDMRIGTNIYIVRELNAREFILNAANKNGAAAGMLDFMKKAVDKTTSGYVYTCGDITAALASNGTALIQAVRLNKEEELGEYAEGRIESAGFAVIKDGRLLGFLTEDETKGACIIENVANVAVVDVTLSSGERVSLGIKKVKAGIEPVFEGDKLQKIRINLKVEANIEQSDGNADIKSEKVRNALAEQLGEIQIERITSALSKSVEMKADFMHIGEKIELRHPVKFSKIKNDWDNIFTAVPFEVTAETEIERTYDIKNMPNMNGES